MKRNNAGLLFRLLVIGLVISWSGSLYAAEVVFKANVPTARKVSVYKMEVPKLDREEVYDRCARVLDAFRFRGFSPEKMKVAGDRYAMLGEDVTCSINRKGTEIFYSNFSALKLTEKTERLFSDKEAIELSYKYLSKAGLMPADKGELKIDHVGGIMQMLSNADTPEKKAVVVYFYRELDGLRVRNFGSSITVTFAEEKVPAGVQYHWREVASKRGFGWRGLLRAEEIKRLIKNDINRVYAKDAKISVDNIELVLYDNGGEYIQPAYLYEGVSHSSAEGVVDMPVAGYVPVLRKVYEPIHHPAYSPELIKPMNNEANMADESDD